MYDVLVTFTDLDDKEGTVYTAGKDKYPRKGIAPTSSRIAELQSSKNKLGKPIIAGAQPKGTPKEPEE